MNKFEDVKLFDKTSLSDIFRQIHKTNKRTDKRIDDLINTLQPLIKSAGEVVMIMPIIKELMDVNIKNNEQLIKISGIAQRTMNNSAPDDIFDMNEVDDLIKQHELNQNNSNKLLESGEKLKLNEPIH